MDLWMMVVLYYSYVDKRFEDKPVITVSLSEEDSNYLACDFAEFGHMVGLYKGVFNAEA